MVIILSHKRQTDEEYYKSVKKLYQLYPEVVMKPSKWKKLRLEILKIEEKLWSK